MRTVCIRRAGFCVRLSRKIGRTRMFVSGRRRVALVVAAAAALIISVPAQAQKFPDRTVKVIVPYVAGGGTDVTARAISQRLSEMWGQPVIVENKPGAAGAVAVQSASSTAVDAIPLAFAGCQTAIRPWPFHTG